MTFKAGNLVKLDKVKIGVDYTAITAIRVLLCPWAGLEWRARYYTIPAEAIGIYLGHYPNEDNVPPREDERHKALFGEVLVWINPDMFKKVS